MIFLAVGTQKFQFNRMLKMIDVLVAQGEITDRVYAQIGHSDYEPAHYAYARFLSKEEFEQRIAICDVLITHSGVATIIAGLKRDKPVIVMPRLVQYAEHVDDHQVEIAEAFSQKNFVLMYTEEVQLRELISQATVHKFDRYQSGKQKAIDTVRAYLHDLQKN